LIDFYRDFRTQIGDKALTKHTFFWEEIWL
jgi:hypothetical protein